LRLSKISKPGDPLERLSKGIDFEMFRSMPEDRLIKESKGTGGRPSFDYVLMFKILILQRCYSLSNNQVKYQINDRPSFMRFLDLSIADDTPDSRTVWNFREQLTDLGLVEELFALFVKEPEKIKLIINASKIMDASFVEVPRQRNRKEENGQIKAGNGATLWEDKPFKKRQKDTDARWTKKTG
jgi:transposase